MDLETNTFEPWHMGARSNIEFGKRAVEEIIKFNDTRKIDTIEDSDIYVPLNKKVELPKYLNASYTSGYEGLVTPIYEDYDETKEGIQEVKIKTKINCEEKDSTVKVHVGNYPFVDGIIDEEIYQNSYDLPSSLGKIYVGKSDLGLALGAKINDTDIWTDGGIVAAHIFPVAGFACVDILDLCSGEVLDGVGIVHHKDKRIAANGLLHHFHALFLRIRLFFSRQAS